MSEMDLAEATRTIELRAAMWSDLVMAEQRWKGDRLQVIRRARIFLAMGLEMEKVLDALKLSPEEWVTRLAETEAAEQANRAFWDQRDAERKRLADVVHLPGELAQPSDTTPGGDR